VSRQSVNYIKTEVSFSFHLSYIDDEPEDTRKPGRKFKIVDDSAESRLVEVRLIRTPILHAGPLSPGV
jgi:hypothetical protein